jgi:hypothetical protein
VVLEPTRVDAIFWRARASTTEADLTRPDPLFTQTNKGLLQEWIAKIVDNRMCGDPGLLAEYVMLNLEKSKIVSEVSREEFLRLDLNEVLVPDAHVRDNFVSKLFKALANRSYISGHLAACNGAG